MQYKQDHKILKPALAAVCLSLATAQLVAQQQRPGQVPETPDRPQSDQLERERPLQRPVRAAEGDEQQLTPEKFVKEAAQGNMLEVQLGQLIAQKSNHPQLKKFGEHLAVEHRTAQQQLLNVAQSLNVTLDRQLDPKHQEKLQKFQTLEGEELNEEVTKFVIKEHAIGIQKYEKASVHTDNPAVQSYVRQTLPHLQQHLQQAQNIAKSIGIDQATIGSLMREAGAVGAPGSGVEVEAGKADEPKPKLDDNTEQPK